LLDPERGVLLHQARQRACELHLVLAVLDADGDAVDGLRRLRGGNLRAAALLGRQRLTGRRFLQAAERDGLAGLGKTALAGLLTKQ
jgi:hypothetical protein